MPDRKPTHRWYHFTLDRLFLGLLVVQVFLLLSEQFRWFPFNEKKGWTVMIAVGVVGLAVSLMLVWGRVCLCIRRQFQFSFRSLLVFLAAVSVPLGWFAWEMQRARKQWEAMESVLGAGGSVTYDFQIGGDGKRITRGQPKIAVWLRKVLGDDVFCEVRGLDCRIDSGLIGDDDARSWEGMTQLTFLYLNGTKITEDGLAQRQPEKRFPAE